MQINKATIVSQLQHEILRLEGFKPSNGTDVDLKLGPIAKAFPNKVFPLGAMHEFLSWEPENLASTTGFISGLLSPLVNGRGIALWISTERKVFPPGLLNFGISPDRIIFIDVKKEKHVMWAMEEALKCSALTAVLGEVQEISFTGSRRLQLAVEQSHVTGFILRNKSKHLSPTACVSRWRVSPLSSHTVENFPGIGFPSWKVELLRVRNGKPDVWDIIWKDGRFLYLHDMFVEIAKTSQNVSTGKTGTFDPSGGLQMATSELSFMSETKVKKAG